MTTFSNPVPGVAIGDPFVLRHRGRFYLYGTNDGPPLPDGRVIPVFRSDDLLNWEPLGGALVPIDRGADHWAPEVLAWNGRFFMVVSFGDVDRTGHALWVAVSDQPEGPFALKAKISTPAEKFSIDGSYLLDDDGQLYLFRCLDFVDDAAPPHGTGIVVQPMRDPFTPIGPPRTVLRADAPWQVFEANRTMPLYEGRTFAEWTTIEGPAPVRRAGRYFCGYSGGNYARAYGTGEAVADAPLGPYTDLRGAEGPIFGTTHGLVEGPGHFSVVSPDLVHDWIALHGRTPGEPVRRLWLCPAEWGPDGVTIGELTDQPQPAPPMPDVVDYFDGLTSWTIADGEWEVFDGGVRSSGEALAWREGVELSGDWALEVYVRNKSSESRGGVRVGEFAVTFCGSEVRIGPEVIQRAAPSLGDDPFDPTVFHAITIRKESGQTEVRIDGVVMASGMASFEAGATLGLQASGGAEFDAVSWTRIP